jgi:GMP synthase-like glutamine amidotransferase
MKKKVLLINCYRDEAESRMEFYLAWLRAGTAAVGLDMEIPILTDKEPLPAGKDLAAAIVSGSQKMVAAGETESGLLEFIKNMRRPLLGICYGHQVLAAAFGCLVKKDVKKHLGDEEIYLQKGGNLFSGFPDVFKMRQSHEEIVAKDEALAAKFHILARNAAGRVEAIAHKEHPLFGVQFHPEKSGEMGVRVLANFLKMLKG